eukprot:gnl/TRDRNA2_/TRDRNA2_178595_c0_seq1.p1 gnl/TRDRNA2_/TRDRNA2_178595_c0~~gnl/TRDRNA2_/TRDRNA2_178595_c0_seq1.p1  ORF type:complete len:123 (+),score=29.72 gnl/TRDRNA2_/TRDRNA2_178595_c0_seq1:72-440(+)
MGWGGYGKGDWGYGGFFPVFNWMGMGKGKGKGGNARKHTQFKNEQKVWVGGIPDGITFKELQAHMKQAGDAKWCEVFSNKGAGNGVCCYATAAEAQAAIVSLNGSTLGTGIIQVDAWTKTQK